MTLVEICSYCRKKFLQCECENFHPNIIVDDEIEFQPAQEYEEEENTGEDVEMDPEPFEVSEARIRLVDSKWEGFKPTDIILSRQECKVLCKFLEKEHIPYHNYELHEVINRLFKFIGEDE